MQTEEIFEDSDDFKLFLQIFFLGGGGTEKEEDNFCRKGKKYFIQITYKIKVKSSTAVQDCFSGIFKINFFHNFL